MEINTYQNERKVSSPTFRRANGTLTAYALHCGYVQRELLNKSGSPLYQVDLYCEYGVYHIQKIDVNSCEIMYWETHETLKEAYKDYFKQLKH